MMHDGLADMWADSGNRNRTWGQVPRAFGVHHDGNPRGRVIAWLPVPVRTLRWPCQ